MNCIYRIECNDKRIKEIYIGSTVDLQSRIRMHKHRSKFKNYKVYKFIKLNGGWDNWSVVVEEDCKSLSKDEIILLEQTYIELLEPELNSNNASGFDKKEYDKEYGKEYKKRRVTCDKCGENTNKHHMARHQRTKKCINNRHPMSMGLLE